MIEFRNIHQKNRVHSSDRPDKTHPAWCDFRSGQGSEFSEAHHSLWIHAIRDKVRFSSISFLKIVLHSFAQNNDLVRIFRSIFFALVDKLRTKSWLPFLALPINAGRCQVLDNIFTNKFEKKQKNKPYKAFSRYRTALSLVGLNCYSIWFYLRLPAAECFPSLS